MPLRASPSAPVAGFSLAETLVALTLIAVTSAAMLPAIAAAARLQRDSARETDGVRIAASRIERLLATAPVAAGGSLDESLPGFSLTTDRAGAAVSPESAEYDCRWRVTRGSVVIVAVRVAARGGGGDVTLATAVARE